MPVGLVPPESVAVSEMLFPTVVSADALVVKAGVMRTFPGLVTLFVDKVTAAVTDMRRPVRVAPLARVTAVPGENVSSEITAGRHSHPGPYLKEDILHVGLVD